MASRVSSFLCAADGDQLNDPVITVLLSITANWSGWQAKGLRQLGFEVSEVDMSRLLSQMCLLRRDPGYEGLTPELDGLA